MCAPVPGCRLSERTGFFGCAGIQFPDYRVPCLIASDSTDCHRVEAELRYVICEVCRSSAEPAPFRKHVPEDFTDADDIFSFHDLTDRI